MERRILISGIVLTLCIISIIGVFFFQSSTNDEANPIKSIPQDAAFIFKLNNFQLLTKLKNGNCKVWTDLLTLPAIKKINDEIIIIDSITKRNPALFEKISQNTTYISGHITGGRKLYFLTIVPFSNGLPLKELIQLAENETKNKITERKYEGKTIASIKINKNNIVHFCIVNNMLLYSTSPVLIEDAIRQTTLSASLMENRGFIKIYEATGKNKDANLFVDFGQIGKLGSLYSKESLSRKLITYNDFGSWAEFDINLKEDMILLNGFSYPNDTSYNFIRTISNDSPVKITIPEVLPSNISGFIAYGASVPTNFYNNYKMYLAQINKLPTYKANLTNMNKKYDINFDEIFLDLLDNQFALAYKNNPSTEKVSKYIILKCKSGQKAGEVIEEMTKKIELKTQNNLKQIYSPDGEISFPIYHLPIYPLFGRLMGEMFNVFDQNYLTVIDNYIIIANSYQDASQFLYEYMLKHTLNNNNNYKEFANNLSIKSYILAYGNTSNSIPYLSDILNEEIVENWNKNPSVFHNANSAGMQISEVSNLPYFNLFLKHQENYRGKPQTVWESMLDSTVSLKPTFVVNHYTKQNEIIVQDNLNNLYLLNQAGRILWKTPLNEKINSEIKQIDYFKNGKLQLIFSTKSALHLLDRNGNYVERYPVKLRSEATAGMSLFDYESNKNYRIFIPCTDKNIYAYSKEGDVISGWKFKGSDHPVTHPVKHFRVEDKDFIVFGDKNRVYILDRKGNYRIKPDKEFSKSENNNYYIYNTGSLKGSFITSTDYEGNIIKIFLNGKTSKQTIKKFSNSHYFDFKDMDADGVNDYIFLNKKHLSVYTQKGKLLFEKEFETNSLLRPIYYHFSYNDRKIGVVSNNYTIHLINSNGKEYKGFPLEGTTQFTVGYFDLTSSRFNLIVGGRNNFLYNYAVE